MISPSYEELVEQFRQFREKTEQVSRESEARLRAFMEHVPALILIKDHELRPVFVNQKFRELFPADDWMGKTPHELFPDEVAGFMVEKDLEALKTGYISYEETWKDITGREHIYHTQKFRIDIPHVAPMLGVIISDITETRRVENDLKIREQQQTLILNTLPVVFYMVNPFGNFPTTWISEKVTSITGYAKDEFLSDDKFWESKLHPEDVERVVGRYYGQGADDNINIEYRFLCADGLYRWFTDRLVVLRDGSGNATNAVGLWYDLTPLKKAESALEKSQLAVRENEERLLTLINATPDIICFKDEMGRWLIANDADLALFSLTNVEYRGKTDADLAEFVDPIYKDAFLNCMESDRKAWEKRAVSRSEEVIPKPDGAIHTFDIIKVPLYLANGDKKGLVVLGRDITDRNAMIADLIAAREKAEKSDRLKTAFLANVSHEIRTPMNAIVGFAQFLADPETGNEERKKYAEIIRSRSDDLLHLISDILDLSRIESGNVTPISKEFSIDQLFNEIETVTRQKLDRLKKSHLLLKFERPLPEGLKYMVADPYLVKQIITNLLDNAIKFTSTGSIVFGYHLPAGGTITLFVSDTGSGIAEEDQAVIFEHFRQAESMKVNHPGGTGLGLAICKGAAELLGGKIGVVSRLNEGSTFLVELPYLTKTVSGAKESESNAVKETPTRQLKDFRWEGKSILIVEDEPANTEYLRILLNKTRAKLDFAETGIKVREKMSTGDPIDLVLLDIRLPDASGWDLAREIKEVRPSTPVIAQTAYAMATDRIRSEEAGCDGYLSKPINKEILFNMIDKYFNP